MLFSKGTNSLKLTRKLIQVGNTSGILKIDRKNMYRNKILPHIFCMCSQVHKVLQFARQ